MIQYRFVFIACLCISQGGYASDSLKLPPVVVTGKKTDFSSIMKVSYGQRSLQKLQNPTLIDVLKITPGVTVVQYGGAGHLSSLYVRGLNANHVHMRVDGLKMDDSSTGITDFSHFLTLGLQSVEVDHGVNLYGADSVVGVLHLRMAKGTGDPHFLGQLETGSRQSLHWDVGVQGERNRFNFNVLVGENSTNGIITQPERLRQPGRVYRPDDYRNRHVCGRVGFDVNEHLSLSFFSKIFQTRLSYVEFEQPWFSKTQQFHQGVQGNYSCFNEKWRHEWSAHIMLKETQDDRIYGGRDPAYRQSHVKRTQQSWTQVIQPHKDHQTRLLLESIQDSLLLKHTVQKAFVSQTGAGVSHRWQAQPWLLFEAGGRYDKTRFPVSPSYRLGTEISPFEKGLQWRMSYGRSVKFPTLCQLYVDQYAGPFTYRSNSFLKSEKSKSWDVGVMHQMRNIKMGLTYFKVHIRDLIELDIPARTYLNGAAMNSHGVECFISVVLYNKITARLDCTTMRPKSSTGKPLLRRPRHKATFSLDYQVKESWNINGDITYVSARQDIDSTTFQPVCHSPHVLCTLRTSYDLTPRLQVYGRVENVLNRRYENPYGYAQPGVGFYIGLRLV